MYRAVSHVLEVVFVALQAHGVPQLRMWTSFDDDDDAAPSADEARALLDAVDDLRRRFDGAFVLGAVPERWLPVLREVQGLSSYKPYAIWRHDRPLDMLVDQSPVAPAGLRFRLGEEQDVEIMDRMSEVTRALDWYSAMLPHTSCLAPDGANPAPAVAWCTSAADLALGPVAVSPEHRRRGLATAVVRQRVDAMRDWYAQGHAAIVYVSAQNPASEAVFRRLGFKPERTVRWLAVPAPDGTGMPASYDFRAPRA